MKTISIFLIFSNAFFALGQQLQHTAFPKTKFSGDILFVDSMKISPGDTLHLGFGSNANKDFIFIMMKKQGMLQPMYLPAGYANYDIIYEKIDHVRVGKETVDYPMFSIYFLKKYYLYADVYNAIQAKEIKP